MSHEASIQYQPVPLDYWHIIAEMQPELVENGNQIVLRTGTRYGRDSSYTDHAKRLIQQAVTDGLIEGQEYNPLGGDIWVRFYQLTPEGIEMHETLVALRHGINGSSGLEETLLPNPF